MARVIFFGTPAHGHINPTLPIVTELTRSGEEVFYFSTEEFRQKIVATGAIYRKYPEVRGFDISESGKNLAQLYLHLVCSTSQMLSELLEEVSTLNPDYIIHDSIAVWGRYVASIKKIPAITSITTFAFSAKPPHWKSVISFISKTRLSGLHKMWKARRVQEDLFKRFGIKPRLFLDTMMNEQPLNIVYGSRFFQPDSSSLSEEKYKFVGPIIGPRPNDSDRTDYSKMKRPLIYVSMGTVWADHYSVDLVSHALANLGGTLVFSGAQPSGASRRENVLVMNHVNQLEVLKYCDVFVSHGGMNSVNESLFYRVPICVFPFQTEQETVADRVVELKCGIRLKKLRERELAIGVNELLHNPEYKINCSRVSESFKEAGGSQRAVSFILDHVRNCGSRKTGIRKRD